MPLQIRPNEPISDDADLHEKLLPFKIDLIRVLKYHFIRRWYIFLALYLLVALFILWQAGVLVRYKAWTSTASLLYQNKSEKVISYYKPMDTRTIPSFILTKEVARLVAKEAKLPDTDAVLGRLLGNTSVTVDKTKPNIVFIDTSYDSPESAKTIVNAFADFGISEYHKHQKGVIDDLILDRKKKIDSYQEELKNIQAKIAELETGEANSILSAPDSTAQETSRSNAIKINQLERDIDESSVKLDVIKSKLALLNKDKFSVSDLEVKVTEKENELMALRNKFTEEHPHVKVILAELRQLKDELGAMKKAGGADSADLVTGLLQKGSVFAEMERTAIQAEIDKISKEVMLKRLKEEQEVLLRSMEKATLDAREKGNLFEEAESVVSKIRKIKVGIDELELFRGETDLSVLEYANIPSSSHRITEILKCMGYALFVVSFLSLFYVVCIVFRRKMISAEEFNICYKLYSFGEMPKEENVPHEILYGAIQKIWRNLYVHRGNAKILQLVNMTGGSNTKKVDLIADFSSLKGRNILKINCIARDKIDNDLVAQLVPYSDRSLGRHLPSLNVKDDWLYFVYEHDHCIQFHELELLKNDLLDLDPFYDVIFLASDYEQHALEPVLQIFSLAGLSVLFCKYCDMNKVVMRNVVNSMKTMSEAVIGGVMTDVPNRYFKE